MGRKLLDFSAFLPLLRPFNYSDETVEDKIEKHDRTQFASFLRLVVVVNGTSEMAIDLNGLATKCSHCHKFGGEGLRACPRCHCQFFCSEACLADACKSGMHMTFCRHMESQIV